MKAVKVWVSIVYVQETQYTKNNHPTLSAACVMCVTLDILSDNVLCEDIAM